MRCNWCDKPKQPHGRITGYRITAEMWLCSIPCYYAFLDTYGQLKTPHIYPYVEIRKEKWG